MSGLRALVSPVDKYGTINVTTGGPSRAFRALPIIVDVLANVAELADAQDLGSCPARGPGSTPGVRIPLRSNILDVSHSRFVHQLLLPLPDRELHTAGFLDRLSTSPPARSAQAAAEEVWVREWVVWAERACDQTLSPSRVVVATSARAGVGESAPWQPVPCSLDS